MPRMGGGRSKGSGSKKVGTAKKGVKVGGARSKLAGKSRRGGGGGMGGLMGGLGPMGFGGGGGMGGGADEEEMEMMMMLEELSQGRLPEGMPPELAAEMLDELGVGRHAARDVVWRR